MRHPGPGLWVSLFLFVPGAVSALPRVSPVPPMWVALVRVVESAPEPPEPPADAGSRPTTVTSHVVHLRWFLIDGRLQWRVERCPHHGGNVVLPPLAPRADAYEPTPAGEPRTEWVRVAPRAIGASGYRPVTTSASVPATGASEVAGETTESMLGRQLAEVLNQVQPERPYLPAGAEPSAGAPSEPGFWPWFRGEILEPSWIVLRSLLALAITFKIADRIWDEF